MTTKTRNDQTAQAPITVTALNPLCEWQTTPVSWSLTPFNPRCLFYGQTTLVIRRTDVLLWIMSVIWEWNNFAAPHIPRCRPVIVKGDTWPEGSPFLRQLEEISNRERTANIPAVFQPDPQIFPLYLNPNAVAEQNVWFRWCIVNREVPPWGERITRKTFLEDLLEYYELNPGLIILDGFLWNGRMSEIKGMLTRLKGQGISVIILNSVKPPDNLSAHKIWDNVLSIDTWRNWRCRPNNIVLRFQRKNGARINVRHHLKKAQNDAPWQEIFDNTDFLRPLIAAWVGEDKTAKQIVEIINGHPELRTRLRRPMTLANLARLKREWGIRTYRPERRPRKRKNDEGGITPQSLEQTNS